VSRSPELAQALAAFQRGDLDEAQRLTELAAASAPSPELDHLLGLIHCRRGDPAAGIEPLRRALDAEPGNAAYRVMLSRALVDSGRAGEVLAMPKPDTGATPASLALWQSRAEAAEAAGDRQAAKEAWEVIADARPADWRAWNNLGNALAALAEWADAADALGRAAVLNPREAPIRRNLALALTNVQRFEDSVEQLAVAVEIDPGDVDTHVTLARLLADLDRHEEALAQLEEAAELGPDRPDIAIALGRTLVALSAFEPAEQAYREALAASTADRTTFHELGLLLERTNRMGSLRDLLAEAAAVGLGPEHLGYLSAAVALREGRAEEAQRLLLTEPVESDAGRWHRLMAKIADARDDADAAFASAEAMNRATQGYDDWRRRGAEYRQRLRQLATIITPQWAASLAQLPPPVRRSPAFLVGFPRSGTTLLDTFLMGHPGAAVLEEAPMLEAALLVAGTLAELADCPPETLEHAREAYFADLDRHVEPGFEGLVIDKLPLSMIGLTLIHSLFPDAPVIFAQRHPCDAVLSGFMQSFVLNDAMACFLDLGDAADLYDAAMEVWTRSRAAVDSRVQTLVYEQLVADPEAALKPLVGFLGLDWRDELLDHRSTARRRGAILTPSYDQVTQPLDARPSGRWKRYQKWMEPVLPVLLPWADRLGYGD
jgi:tetratricopeptide (TPR) repeat protein